MNHFKTELFNLNNEFNDRVEDEKKHLLELFMRFLEERYLNESQISEPVEEAEVEKSKSSYTIGL
jgi:hypothetical protein